VTAPESVALRPNRPVVGKIMGSESSGEGAEASGHMCGVIRFCNVEYGGELAMRANAQLGGTRHLTELHSEDASTK